MTKINNHYKYIVIGAGSGGLTVAVGLAALKKDMLLVSKDLGGECTNSGCVPSKMSIRLANEYYSETSKEKAQEIKNNFFKNVNKKIKQIHKEETELLEKQEINFLQGEAKFISKNQIQVKTESGNKKITFDKAIISSGSTPRRISDLNLPAHKILTNEEVFNLKEIPKTLTVIGCGPIGAELSMVFAKMGTRVTVVTTSTCLDKEQPEFSKIIAKKMKDLGIELIEHVDREKVNQEVEMLPESDYYLVSVGRIPNTNLNLEAAGIKYSDKGIKVNKNFKTSNSNVYAVGDCIPEPKFTHLANNQGRFVVKKMLLPWARKKETPLPWVTYVDPPISSVGKTIESEFIKRFEIDFTKSDRGIIDDLELMKGYVFVHMLTGVIKGATLIGRDAESNINFFTLAIKKKMKVFELENFMAPYPTYFSGIQSLYSSFMATFFAELKQNLKKVVVHNKKRITVAFLWILIACVVWSKLKSLGFDTDLLIEYLVDLFTSPIGVGLFVLAYSLRSLIGFSATLLSVLAGFLYGFAPGIIITIVASNISSTVNYFLGSSVFSIESQKEDEGLKAKIRDNTFEAVLIARLSFFPYDLLSFIAGALKVGYWPFILATALGSIPGTVAIVSFGASLENIRDFDKFSIEPKFLILSVVLMVSGILLSKFIKKKGSAVTENKS